MRYKVHPVGYVSSEAGHHSGPPLMAETVPMEEAAGTKDPTIDIVVITIESDEHLVASGMERNDFPHIITGEQNPDRPPPRIVHLGLWPKDAAQLCVHLLRHLHRMDHRIGSRLLEKLPEVLDEIRLEDSARNDQGPQ